MNMPLLQVEKGKLTGPLPPAPIGAFFGGKQGDVVWHLFVCGGSFGFVKEQRTESSAKHVGGFSLPDVRFPTRPYEGLIWSKPGCRGGGGYILGKPSSLLYRVLFHI